MLKYSDEDVKGKIKGFMDSGSVPQLCHAEQARCCKRWCEPLPRLSFGVHPLS